MQVQTDTKYIVSVRHYFDKANGNSYYTMRIMGTDDTDVTTPFAYGHGDTTYREHAARFLGLDWSGMDWDTRRAMFTLEETTVTRRKDMHNAGK